MPDLMTVAGIALKTSLLIAVAGLLSVALRRQSAAFKHLLWTSALALCVLMPFAVFFLPSHAVATLPPPIHGEGNGNGWGLLELTLSIWFVGTVCILARELLSSVGLASWQRHAQPLSSARWAATLARISATQTPGTRRMRVFESRRIASPCTWGVLRPVLLLPTSGDAWPESARHSALLHELAHVRRVDALSTLVSRLACAMHWYNPLVWLAAERVRSLQERACDDAVLCAGAMPSEYAQFLLDVAAHVSGMSRPTRLAIGMAHGSSLHSRIVAILDPAATRSQPRRTRVIAACASLFAFTIFLATASVAIEPPPAPPSPTQPVPSLPPVPAIPAVPATSATPAVPPLLPTPPIPPVQPRL